MNIFAQYLVSINVVNNLLKMVLTVYEDFEFVQGCNKTAKMNLFSP